MYKFLWVVCILVFFTCGAGAAEYRSFTNQGGKTIVARIIDYDAETGKVQLELKNRKKAWVDLVSLSGEDQAYILEHQAGSTDQKAEPEAATSEALSKEEVRKISKQYEEAMEEQNAEVMGRLFAESASWDFSNLRFNQSFVDNVNILSIEENKFYVRSSDGIPMLGMMGWVQLTPEGKIKYCPLIAPHPIEYVIWELKHLQRVRAISDLDRIPSFISNVEKTGIPTFGLSSSQSNSDMTRSIKKIRDWILDNYDTFDNSEPKLFLPKSQKTVIREALQEDI